MGGAVSAGVDNDHLIDNLREAGYIKTWPVEQVFRAVDRGHYFTSECQDSAYKDLAWKCGNMHISAPCIYSEVMENLELKPNMSFLNLGSGTGYLSTMAGLILGSYGINHGVEYYEDVLNYANQRLEEFCLKSNAVDEFEFCVPKFVKGDCLLLGSEPRLYDRVYCGAACPEQYEQYMKHLIKVGGILVVPINDQLLQVHRTSVNTWETRSLLPVSFATLLTKESNSSTVSGVGDVVTLPENEPPKLQEICRFTIRDFLRRIITTEHPELKMKPPRTVRGPAKKRALRRLVIPIFGGSSDIDEEEEGENNGDRRDFGRAGLVMDINSDVGALIELREFLQGPPRPSQSNERVEPEPAVMEVDRSSDDNGETSTESKRTNRREKFDSGIVEDIENNGMDSDDIGEEEEDDENDEEDEDDDMDDGLYSDSEFSDVGLSDNDDVNKQELSCDNEQTVNSTLSVIPTYTTYMICKINKLPLPLTLKRYLNLHRAL